MVANMATRKLPSRADDTMRRLLRRIDPQGRLEVYRVWTFWAEEVGEAIATRAEPAAYRAGVLTIRVSSAAWMQELQFLKESLRSKLNARLGAEQIQDIAFVSGAVGQGRQSERRPRVAAPMQAAPASRALDELPRRDPELAAVFERLIRAQQRRRGEPAS
jgi:predicted nucleic acid-binding Zn ribbon protein